MKNQEQNYTHEATITIEVSHFKVRILLFQLKIPLLTIKNIIILSISMCNNELLSINKRFSIITVKIESKQRFQFIIFDEIFIFA